jgi:hypothetical protein
MENTIAQPGKVKERKCQFRAVQEKKTSEYPPFEALIIVSTYLKTSLFKVMNKLT